MKVLCLYFGNTPHLNNIAELFLPLTPQIALRGQEAIFLEMTKGHRLLSEESFLKRALVILRKYDLLPRHAVAEDPGTALAFCKFFTQRKNLLPVEALQCYLDPFAVSSSYDVAFTKLVPHLERLGIKSVRDFLTFSPTALPSRFAPLGLHLFTQLRGGAASPWPAFVREQHVVEKILIPRLCRSYDAEVSEFYISTLLERGRLRLRARGLPLTHFEVSITQEHPDNYFEREQKVSVQFARPWNAGRKELVSITKEKVHEALERHHRFGPIAALELRILDRTVEKNAASESWYELVTRLYR
ncbi:MAG: hypothetical protein EOP06_28970, partial [Proteobacteria bacterium]